MLADTLSPMSSAEGPVVFDRAAGFYDATRGFPAGVEQRVADAIAQAGRLGRGSRVLEIGVGTGRIALPLAKQVDRVVGIDLSRLMMQQLLAKRGDLGVDLARADATRLPFPDASFDAAIGVHIFHLIPGWRAVLSELGRVLRPGAPLLHGADDRSGAWAQWRDRFGAQHRVENVGVPSDRFDEFPENEGWRALGPVHRIRYAREITPRELVDRIASRTWSFTWRLDEAQLAEATEALRAELFERYGDLDRPVETESGFWVRSYQSPHR